ncbi:hypothetical protein RG677_003499 [Vibrio parahaemolyticus]|uniref:competence protein CoiA family protein n=1 Tax=Vibrio parahaemolyticus TaxID=670 RepID=UPI001299A2B8|nr:hypothetical protein [Vibrio parahaemolyticus]EJB8573776.1 hypothetical protein [Vibrio parahaemolyticus]ELB2952019.1 hypothetical protein [Vibrio parahaemolyticus]MCZ6379476.1 hypothetical protein [Vibrio parahaemolyticus]MRD94979.1 hypothetical protein [Vibrio parahaemolyticus]
MLLANHNGVRKRAEQASSGAIGSCPWTQHPVKAHVGLLRQYWAYIGDAPTFPDGYEPESEWHVTWKIPVQDQYCEVIFGSNNEHRADILGSNNTVIEIQRSVIDIRDSRERVEFYQRETGRRVIWVVDIQEFWMKRFFLTGKPDKEGRYKVNWKPKRTWLWDLAANTKTNVFLEFNQSNDKLLHVWIHKKEMIAQFIKKSDFFKRYMQDVAKPEYSKAEDAVAILRTKSD